MNKQLKKKYEIDIHWDSNFLPKVSTSIYKKYLKKYITWKQNKLYLFTSVLFNEINLNI